MKTYSPNWTLIYNNILGLKGKCNFLQAAYEGGHRLKRRYHNMCVAFTYGAKLKYDDLDDPQLEEKIQNRLAARSKNKGGKQKIFKINDMLLTAEKATLQTSGPTSPASTAKKDEGLQVIDEIVDGPMDGAEGSSSRNVTATSQLTSNVTGAMATDPSNGFL